jgi:hypothetical protein
MLPHEDTSQTPGFPVWVRVVALVVIVALVGFFALSAF